MAVYTDIHNYTINASSAPWRRVGSSSISVSGGLITLADQAIIRRVTPLVGNWILECEVRLDTGSFVPGSGARGAGFGLPYTSAAAFQAPGVGGPGDNLNAYAAIWSQYNAVAAPAEGDPSGWGPRGIGVGADAFIGWDFATWQAISTVGGVIISGGPYVLSHPPPTIFRMQFIVQPALQRVSANVWEGSLRRRSGWENDWIGLISDWQEPRIGGFRFGPGCRINTITLTDSLTDAQVVGAEESGEIPPPPPSLSSVFPASTGKPSHARILRGHRTPQEAQAFHEAMRIAG